MDEALLSTTNWLQLITSRLAGGGLELPQTKHADNQGRGNITT